MSTKPDITGWQIVAEKATGPDKNFTVATRAQARRIRVSLRRRGFTTHDPKPVTR